MKTGETTAKLQSLTLIVIKEIIFQFPVSRVSVGHTGFFMLLRLGCLGTKVIAVPVKFSKMETLSVTDFVRSDIFYKLQ